MPGAVLGGDTVNIEVVHWYSDGSSPFVMMLS